MSTPRFDRIGYWSEVKLDIVRKYAQAYSTILSAQSRPSLHHVYIDGFAGAGVAIARSTGEFVPGSPLNALGIQPPFREFHLIDLDGDKLDHLRETVGGRTDVHLYRGDCNRVLLDEVFPQVLFEQYRRGLCLLDPYGLHLRWDVIERAGKMGTIDMFLNFPTMDMNMNVLWAKPSAVDPEQAARLTAFWGDESWREAAYRKEPTLFGEEDAKTDNDTVAEAFRERLRKVAGFARVPEPVPMRNSRGAVVYYLFFASQRNVAEDIVTDIFDSYRDRRPTG